MNFSFRFQVVGMDVVETEFEMISLAAATANVVTFLMLTRAERPATPNDAAGKSREEMPKEGWRAELECSTTELEARRELSFREDRPNNRSLGALRAVPDASGVLVVATAIGGTAVATRTSALGGTEVRSETWMSISVIQASASGAGR
ncbi:hypothetical protein [Tardiphaga sp.]|jgi:hypothetical protein|uniref:hypothetical protein n=1 Tax=Tardiphaga sp. TaxID=1926292 RepID=UPI0037DA0579